MRKQDPKFSTLYAQFAAHVWRMARHFGVARDQLDDFTQEVWISVLRQLDELDLSRSPRAWLTAVAWNHARHVRRSRARFLRKSEALTVVGELTHTYDRDAKQKEASWTLQSLLAELLCRVALSP